MIRFKKTLDLLYNCAIIVADQAYNLTVVQHNNQLRSNLKKLLVFVCAFVALSIIAYIGVKLDMWFHPWLSTAAAEWRWYNYLTSSHGGTILYLNHLWICAIMIGIISGVITLVVDD